MIRARRMAAVATVLMLVGACSDGSTPSVEPTARSSTSVGPTAVATAPSLDESCKLAGERPGVVTLTSDDSNLYVAFEGLPPSSTGTTGYFVSVYDKDGNGGQLGARYLDGEQMAFFIAIDVRQTNLPGATSVTGNQVKMVFPKRAGSLGDLDIAKWNASWSLAGADVGTCPLDHMTQPVTGSASDGSDSSGFNQPSAAATSPTLTGPWAGIDGQRVAVSDVCRQSMTRAARERDVARANPLILTSLSACSDADEWLSELERQPAVMGLTERAGIGRLSLIAACGGAPSTPVCVDAAARGVRF